MAPALYASAIFEHIECVRRIHVWPAINVPPALLLLLAPLVWDTARRPIPINCLPTRATGAAADRRSGSAVEPIMRCYQRRFRISCWGCCSGAPAATSRHDGLCDVPVSSRCRRTDGRLLLDPGPRCMHAQMLAVTSATMLINEYSLNLTLRRPREQ